MKLLVALVLLFGLAAAQAEPFRDCADCPAMVSLPAGSFQMGGPMPASASPIHAVGIRAFAIGEHEVTQGEWRALMGANPSKAVDCGDACPVENVNWFEAQAYIRRLSAKSGKRYRLPSEAEWEYACRAGQTTDWCGADEPAAVAWVGDEYGGPHPVGQKRANAWGLYDMSGNVWEWTQDCSHPSYVGAPADGSAWEEPECKSRILRGGSWLSGPQYSRSTLRFGFSPKFRAGDFGFRVARDID